MKTISDKQAQELADDFDVFIACDKDGSVFAFDHKPVARKCEWVNNIEGFGGVFQLPVNLISNREFKDRLWTPLNRKTQG